MEAVIGTLVTALIAAMGLVLNDARKSKRDHRECMEAQAIIAEKLGGLYQISRILTRHQPEDVRKEVSDAIEAIDRKASKAAAKLKGEVWDSDPLRQLKKEAEAAETIRQDR